jgi:hypothetical protein
LDFIELAVIYLSCAISNWKRRFYYVKSCLKFKSSNFKLRIAWNHLNSDSVFQKTSIVFIVNIPHNPKCIVISLLTFSTIQKESFIVNIFHQTDNKNLNISSYTTNLSKDPNNKNQSIKNITYTLYKYYIMTCILSFLKSVG